MPRLAEICRLLLLLAFGILSGCGARSCVYTDAGCNANPKKPDNGCREFGGPTTRCQTPAGERTIDRRAGLVQGALIAL
jgi:hypothetical protein